MNPKSKLLLLTTACVEIGTGLCLLFLPSVVFAILLGFEQASADALFVGRIAGAALLAIGLASWIARVDDLTIAQFGLFSGILFYDVAASVLLAYAGMVLKMVGILLWPAVVLHAVLAGWAFSCLGPNRIPWASIRRLAVGRSNDLK
jgi:hypothetical protein